MIPQRKLVGYVVVNGQKRNVYQRPGNTKSYFYSNGRSVPANKKFHLVHQEPTKYLYGFTYVKNRKRNVYKVSKAQKFAYVYHNGTAVHPTKTIYVT